MSVYVNKFEITELDIGQEMQFHPAPSRERAWQLAAQSLVIRQLLLQQAAEDGYYPVADAEGDTDSDARDTQAEEQAIDNLLEENISVPKADGATCRRFYETHPGSFRDDQSEDRLAFDQAQHQIRDYLHTKAMRMAIAEYIKALSYRAEIKGIELVNL